MRSRRDLLTASAHLAGSVLVLLLPGTAAAAPPPDRASLVTAARTYLGRPFSWGGRDRELDCLGLIFLSWQDVTGTSWKRISVYPTKMVAREQLGAPVPGLDGVRSAAIPWDQLEPGDFLLFLGSAENPAEPALTTVDGTPMWVWHTGLYSGGPERRFVVGDHFAGQVVETSLPRYLRQEGSGYEGLFVVRPALPSGDIDALHVPPPADATR